MNDELWPALLLNTTSARTFFLLFLFPLELCSQLLSLHPKIHYDRRFINRSNLQYMLTPDDLFFILCSLQKRTGKIFFQTPANEMRPSNVLGKSDTPEKKLKHFSKRNSMRNEKKVHKSNLMLARWKFSRLKAGLWGSGASVNEG